VRKSGALASFDLRETSREQESQVPLGGVLAEFRAALDAEIEAATASAAGSAVPLINGKRIAQVAGYYHYAFTIESALMLPNDAEGDLHIQGRAPVAASIVSVEGTAVTISVSEDLGDYVPLARLQSDLVYLLRSLIRRIEEYGEKHRPNPAGDRLLAHGEVTGSPVDLSMELPADLVEELGRRLNQDQLAAVASALGRNTTFIWGPPGTGKTSTIGAIGEALYQQDRSLLLVSHTNAAVDQALLRIGDALGEDELRRGMVFRIGQPKDQRLQESEELLLPTHVARRSKELVERREQLRSDHAEREAALEQVHALLDLCEWAAKASDEIADRQAELDRLKSLRAEIASVQEESRELEAAVARNRSLRNQLEEPMAVEERLSGSEREIEATTDRLEHLPDDLERLQRKLDDEQGWLEQARALEPKYLRRYKLPSQEEQAAAVAQAERETDAASSIREEASRQLAEQQAILSASQDAGALRRRLKGLPSPEQQQATVAQAQEQHDVVQQATEEAIRALVEARSLKKELEALDEELIAWDQLGPVDERERAVGVAEHDLAELRRQQAQLPAELEELKTRQHEDQRILEEFIDEHSARPSEISARLAEEIERAGQARSRLEELDGQVGKLDEAITGWAGRRLRMLRGAGLEAEPSADGAEALFETVRGKQGAALKLADQQDPGELRSTETAIKDRISAIQSEIAEIDEALEQVEATLISEAKVIGATLTKTYLDDRLQERSFDSVLLDEASMAPIPALWAAAGTAAKNLVIVGDQKQLPPISHAADPEKEPKSPATLWLGRDVFTAAGVNGETPPWLVSLRTQYRMKPAISRIANELAYGGGLHDGEGVDSDRGLGDWYRVDWGHDSDVLLVDTESLGAWVTSVPRGGRASRLNFLSATVCVDLVGEMLHPDRPPWQPGEHARIIIVSPYRAHARLLSLMLREQKLEGEVEAGTVHTFQGSEAPVVIFDTVVDEPHWKVNLFIPAINEEIRRLLNVAVTRAQSRLVLVGDFNYIHRQAKKAVLNDLVAQAEAIGTQVEAREALQVGLSARAARAQSLTEGSLKADHDAGRMVMTQEAFFGKLTQDLTAAKKRVVIYSPFMSQNRLGQLAPHLKAAIERGVRVYVVTKTATPEERKGQLETYRQIEAALEAWGVIIAHKRNMHEKVVLIDDEILWTGSLNALSFSDTQEIMERRKSAKIAEDYIETLRTNELLELFAAGEARCPVCNEELVASEGTDEPFYWRCLTAGCHTRSIGDPAPKDGRIVCRNCGKPVEFVDMPSGPHWRCTENKRHRQKVIRNHLKLPKMREIIPKQGLKKLDRKFGLDPAGPNSGTPSRDARPTRKASVSENGKKTVTAGDLAERLNVDPKDLRAWLRQGAKDGHELLAGHVHGKGWHFTEAEAEQLGEEYDEAHGG
jgi:hypothetical protein